MHGIRMWRGQPRRFCCRRKPVKKTASSKKASSMVIPFDQLPEHLRRPSVRDCQANDRDK
jgi:hypothetical protein